MKTILIQSMLAASILVLSSCGGGGGEESTNEQGIKVVRLPMRTDGPKSLDPVRGSTTYDNRIICNVYETLVQYHHLVRPTDARTLEPLLLAKMPEVSEDGLTYHFTLKEGVFFHDDPCFPDGKGRQVVSADVIYSWKRLADDGNDPKSWWILENTIRGFDAYRAEQNEADEFDYDAEVEGFNIINDREFEVTLVEPIYRFMYTLAMFQLSVVPREACQTYGTKFGVHPVGTGPFIIKEEDWETGQSIVMNRNPNYHECYYPEIPEEDYPGKDVDIERGYYENAGERLPLVDRVEITMFKEDQPMWLKFRSKEIDYTQVPDENHDTAFNVRNNRLVKDFKDEGIVDHPVPLLDFIFIGFNMEDELLGGYDDESKYLRQAISIALDWDERNQTFYSGNNIIYDGPIPPGLQGHPADHRTENSYIGPDLARARELLAMAGYPDGEGLPVLDYYTSRSANIPEQTAMLERQLARINIRINKNLVDFSTLIENITKKKAPFFSFAWGSDYPDAENNLALFYGPNASPGSNHFNYQRDEYDAMYLEARTLPPNERRLELYEAMRDMVIEDAPYIGAMARTRFYLVNPRLQNYKPSEDFYNWIKYMNVPAE